MSGIILNDQTEARQNNFNELHGIFWEQLYEEFIAGDSRTFYDRCLQLGNSLGTQEQTVHKVFIKAYAQVKQHLKDQTAFDKTYFTNIKTITYIYIF